MRNMLSVEQPACRRATRGNVLEGAVGLRGSGRFPPEASGLAEPVRGVYASPCAAQTPLLTWRASACGAQDLYERPNKVLARPRLAEHPHLLPRDLRVRD